MLHMVQQQHRYISCEDLRTSALARLGLSHDDASVANDPKMSVQGLAGQLLPAFSVGLLTISLHPATVGTEPGQRPKVQPLTRWQAARSDCVTNRYHENVRLDPLCRHLVCRLDGAHNRNTLEASVRHAVASGNMKIAQNGQPLKVLSDDMASHLVDRALCVVSQQSLLTP